MSVHLFITIKINIDTENGLPFVWGRNGEKIQYNPKDYVVPERYRKWLRVSGSHFRAYIADCIPNADSVSIEYFQAVFPTWDTVQERIETARYDWYPFDHNGFKQAIDWFVEQNVFGIEWSA
jgi:hypothetical protein